MPGKTFLQRLEPLLRAAYRSRRPIAAGPPSSFRQLRDLTERMRDWKDLRFPDAQATKPTSAPTARRGRPPYPWSRITQIVAEFCRTYFTTDNRAPTWKQRREALSKVLGSKKTPHIETLKKKLRPR
jgi:hypothetical protein